MNALNNLSSNEQEPRPGPQRPLLRITLLCLVAVFLAGCGLRLGRWLAFPGSTWLGWSLGFLIGAGVVVAEIMELKKSKRQR
jgi:hypothetical protein